MSSASTDHITPLYKGSGDLEKGYSAPAIQRVITPGGHPADFSQPGIPVQHRKFGNPSVAGLFSFGLGFMLVGLFNLHARDIRSLQLLMPSMVFTGGLVQFVVGWMEMNLGNTFAGALFLMYGSFNFSFACMFFPAFGVIAAYTKPDGTPDPEMSQALGLYFILWAIVSFIFLLGSFRSSYPIVFTLLMVALIFICLAINSMTGSDAARIAGGIFCCLGATTGFYAGCAGYWTPDATSPFIRLPPLGLAPKED